MKQPHGNTLMQNNKHQYTDELEPNNLRRKKKATFIGL